MARRYFTLNVFTDTRLRGNPLAIVLDADDLDTAAMQAIAAEFNLSETAFVLAATGPAHTAAIRIFTPRRELPFAGHPTIGVAVLLAGEKLGPGPDERDAVIVLEEPIGPVRCGVILRQGTGYALVDAPRLPAEIGPAPAADLVAAALGLAVGDVGFGQHVPSVFAAGMPFLFAPIANLEAIGRAKPDAGRLDEALAAARARGIFCYTHETSTVGRQFHARMFAPGMGIAEDPATGSAALAFAGVVERFEALGHGSHQLVIEQGLEMGRPSLIGLEIDRSPERIEAVRIGGDAVIVSEGTLRL